MPIYFVMLEFPTTEGRTFPMSATYEVVTDQFDYVDYAREHTAILYDIEPDLLRLGGTDKIGYAPGIKVPGIYGMEIKY